MTIRINSIYLILLITTYNSCISGHEHKKNIDNGINDFKQIYTYALRGELDSVFLCLDTVNESCLTNEELEFKRKFYNRFYYQSEFFDYNTYDSEIIGFVDKFHSYWKTILLRQQSVDEADSTFIQSMASYLFLKRYANENISIDTIRENISAYSNKYIKEKGYYANAFGKTGHLYDLFLWKEEEHIVYPIDLVDDSVKVVVHLMKDFISTGWTHYTTFGKSYASGWATNDALFCIAKAYDLESENYRVSYLAHEGQHFSDYIRFPNLKQPDLEYRAKLVELIKSEGTTKQLIFKFISNTSKKSDNAHAFANYQVIADLSSNIFQKNYVEENAEWHNCNSDIIKISSQRLFEKNTEELTYIGNDSVSEWITNK